VEAGVGEYRSRDQARVPGGQQAENGTPPILANDRYIIQIERSDEVGDLAGVEFQGVHPRIAGFVTQAEADEVRRYDAHAGAGQAADHLAPKEGPGGVAVLENYRRALAFVDKVLRVGLAAVEAAVEWKGALQPGGQWWR